MIILLHCIAYIALLDYTAYTASFQDPFLMGLWNATYLGPSAKLLYFENQIATFVGIWEKLLLFETRIATFVGISKKLPFFTESAAFPRKSTNLLLLV